MVPGSSLLTRWVYKGVSSSNRSLDLQAERTLHELALKLGVELGGLALATPGGVPLSWSWSQRHNETMAYNSSDKCKAAERGSGATHIHGQFWAVSNALGGRADMKSLPTEGTTGVWKVSWWPRTMQTYTKNSRVGPRSSFGIFQGQTVAPEILNRINQQTCKKKI
jgi:hypothetical protein